ncbi:MAG: DUF6602 domain-containing protein [Blastocatellales bacterium]
MLPKLFASIEQTLLARFREAGFIKHAGDKGENREHILRDFLSNHLPKKYGVTKGEILTKDGKHSHSADIIIFDALNSPLLYSEKTAIVPIEGVFGIIEVKSSLSKAEFVNAARQIESFKRIAPRDLGVIETRHYLTVHRPSRPFGIILGFDFAENSLESLSRNWEELNKEIHDVNYFVNFACVLGEGLLRYEKVNLTVGEKTLLVDTDEFVNIILTEQKRANNKEQRDEIILRIVVEQLKEGTFGRFFVYLLIMLSRMKINVPDLGQYIDPDLPITVIRES